MTGNLVDLVIEDPGWDAAVPDLERIAEQAGRLALEAVSLDPGDWTICVLATGDAEIADLNRQFRGRVGATNVLSWPAFDLASSGPGGLPRPPKAPKSGLRTALGDVAIALQTVQREAEAAAIPLKDHAIHLILHGCLHLLGFDHQSDDDAEMMERIEAQALQRIGVPDPYSRGSSGPGAPD